MRMKKYFLSILSLVFLLTTVSVPSRAMARDPVIQSCNHPTPALDGLGFVTVYSQTSSTPTLAWGVTFTAAGIAAIGNPITLSLSSATVLKDSLELRTISPGTLYSPHLEPQPYTFHGSFSSYSYAGSSTSATLEATDVVRLTFSATGADGDYTNFGVYCKMPYSI